MKQKVIDVVKEDWRIQTCQFEYLPHLKLDFVMWHVAVFTGTLLLCFLSERVNSHNTQYADSRLLADLSISNQIDFVAGRFRRESVIFYRLLSSDFSTNKFSLVRTEELKRDYVVSAH